jgi:glycosyltransferase involved in cell wall biosynthesis
MNNQPLVSILINNYNYAHFLPDSINSALNQTYSNTEIVVVDDGSIDNSKQVIESYGNQITYIFKKNGGQASAFNAGFQASKGEIICFLDADDTYTPDKIIKIVEFFRQYPNADWLFHQLDDVDVTGKSLELKRDVGVSELIFIDLREQILKGGNLPKFQATSALCFKRKLIAKFLPMPEQLRISADHFLRLASIYMSPGILSPDKLATHRIHGANLFEFNSDIEFVYAETNIKTCYYLRQLFPETKSYTDIIYAHSVGRLAGKSNFLKVLRIPETKEYIKQYFSFQFGIKAVPRIFYNYFKAALSSLKPAIKVN